MAIDISFLAPSFLVETASIEIAFVAPSFLTETLGVEVSFLSPSFLVSEEPNPSAGRRRQIISTF